jgi:hypothetical protein
VIQPPECEVQVDSGTPYRGIGKPGGWDGYSQREEHVNGCEEPARPIRMAPRVRLADSKPLLMAIRNLRLSTSARPDRAARIAGWGERGARRRVSSFALTNGLTELSAS